MRRETAFKILAGVKQSYNIIAEDFSRTRQIFWEQFRPLADYVKEGDQILDLGCGNGRLSELFNKRRVGYIGIDISEELIKIARQRHPQNNFQVFDGLNIPLADNHFDVVFCIAVLHHIPGVELKKQFLKEIYRVLKPSGRLILSVWYLWQRGTYWRLFFEETVKKIFGLSELDFFDTMVPWGKKSKRYFHNFRHSELARLVVGAGLEIKKTGILHRGPKNKNLLVVAQKP